MKTITILIIFLMTACGGGSENENRNSESLFEMAPEMEVADAAAPMRKVGVQEQEEYEKKVIKTAGLSYQVANTREEYRRLKSLTEKYNAYISNENESKSSDRINYSVSIKVPPQHFDALISDIVEDRRLDSRWVSAEDVTDRYYDLKSRIENKKKLEERYQEILKQATKISDILEVERNLNQVRTEIESLQGQLKRLNHRIDYSSIEVSFYEMIPYELAKEPRPGFGTRMRNALTAGWQAFQTFLVFILALWPFALVTLAVLWVVKKVREKKKSG